jgi:hypothetical protein
MIVASALLQTIDFKLYERPALDWLPSSIAIFNEVFGGVPRGCVTDVYGPASSCRTTLLFSLLAQATAQEEYCALVDASDAFDPTSAVAASVALERLLWIRCGGNAEHALKATDLLLLAGGFGLVAMDLGDIAPVTARRISLASWYRLRRSVENTPSALVVIERAPHARACAQLAVACSRSGLKWSGTAGCSKLLRSVEFTIDRHKPLRPGDAVIEAHALR